MKCFLRCTGWVLPLLLLLLLPDGLFAQTDAERLAWLAEGRLLKDRWYHEEAGREVVDRARATYRKVYASGQRDSLSAEAYHGTGVTYYLDDEERTALNYYDRAIAIWDDIYPEAHNKQAHTRTLAARCYQYLGRPDSVILLLATATEIFERVDRPDSTNYLRALTTLAQVSQQQEDFQVASSAAAAALNLLDKFTGVDEGLRLNTYRVIGNVLLELAEYDRALAVARDYVTHSRQSDNPKEEGAAYEQMSYALSETGGAEAEAATYLNRAISLYEEHELDHLLAYPYISKAIVLREAGRFDEARVFAQRANRIASSGEDLDEYLRTLLLFCNIYEETAEYGRMLDTADHATNYLLGLDPAASRLARPAVDSIDAGLLSWLVSFVANRAVALSGMKRFAEARADFDYQMVLQDRMRNGVTTDASRRFLSGQRRFAADAAIRNLFEESRTTGDTTLLWNALGIAEEARAFTLLHQLENRAHDLPRQEAELRDRIIRLEQETATDASVASRLEVARLQLDRLRSARPAENDHPLSGLDRAVLTDHLRERNTDLLLYHLGDAASFVFHLASTGTLKMYPINVDGLDSRVENWRAAISASAYRRKSLRDPALQERLDADFLRIGTGLSNDLLPAPLLETLHRRAAALVILPDGALNYLPFAALPLGKHEGPVDYRKLEYLQSGRSIQYAYSARFLLRAEKAAPRKSVNLLAFAPTFRGSSPVGATSRAVLGSQATTNLRALPGMQPLRFNGEEVAAVSALVPGGQVFVGPTATLGNFLARAATARILHLSSHGMVNGSDPNLSFVAFTQRGDSLEIEELLFYNDLSALELDCELAVLSACETSLGKLSRGETALSLASAFSAAGARSTLTTLWQVDDAATKELVVRFYEELAAGKDRTTALAAAQTAHRESADYAHPYYWSAMTLHGAGGPLALDVATPVWYLYVAVAAVISLGLWGWFRARR